MKAAFFLGIIASSLGSSGKASAQSYVELLVSPDPIFVDGRDLAGLDSGSVTSGFIWDRRAWDSGPTLTTTAAGNAVYAVNNVERIMSTGTSGPDSFFPFYGPGIPRVVLSPTANGTGSGSFSATIDLGSNLLTPPDGFTVSGSYIDLFDYGLNRDPQPIPFSTMDFQVFVNDGSGPTPLTDLSLLSYDPLDTDAGSAGYVSDLGGGTFRFNSTGYPTTGQGLRIYGSTSGSFVQSVSFFNSQTATSDAIAFRAGRTIDTVPEPSSLVLTASLAAAGLAFRRRCRS